MIILPQYTISNIASNEVFLSILKRAYVINGCIAILVYEVFNLLQATQSGFNHRGCVTDIALVYLVGAALLQNPLSRQPINTQYAS